MGKKYKTVLGMVWGTSDSLLFKIQFTWIILRKRINMKNLKNYFKNMIPVSKFSAVAKRDKSGRIRYHIYINGERVHDELTINGWAFDFKKGKK